MLGKFSINYVKMIAKQVIFKIPKSWISQNYLFIHLFWFPLLTNSRTYKTARDLHTPKDFTSPMFNWFLASLSRVSWYCHNRNETYRSELYTCALELQELLNTNRKLYFEYQLTILSSFYISILHNWIAR